MHWIDWSIVTVAVILITWLSIKTASYMKGVADFLSANRSAGRYLGSLAGGMAGIGAISVVALFEVYSVAGLPPFWWEQLIIPLNFILVMTAWMTYRFRETRCLTIQQFYEVRYSKPFRVYAGIITWISGIINFGIFPAVASNFFVYYCGLPPTVTVMGIAIKTQIIVMILTLSMAMAYTNLGGHITVIITDCVQGIFCGFVFIVISIFLMVKFNWVDIVSVMREVGTGGKSMLNPYDTENVPDFNFYFYLILLFGTFYGYMSWQGSSGYKASSLTPHESKMSGIIGQWRGVAQKLMLVLIPVCAITFLAVPQFSDQAALVNEQLATFESDTLAKQMRVPIAMAYMLPVGLKGLICVAMIFFLITTQDTYLHSWGTIFVQDVVMPFRKKKLTPAQHITMLRWSIAGVAVFAFFFALFYKQNEYIMMFQAVTGAIIAGAGAVLIGGLYWKRASTSAAWTAMTVGWVMAIGRMILGQMAPHYEDIVDRGLFLQIMDLTLKPTGQVYSFYTMIACSVTFFIVSILSFVKPFNLEPMLHRGQYAIEGEHVVGMGKPKSIWLRVIHITEEFSFTDRCLAIALLGWNIIWVTLFAGVTIYTKLVPGGGFSIEAWARFWHIWVWIQIIIGIPVTIWFTIGGIKDIRKTLNRLKTLKRDHRDDGSVTAHHLPTDEAENGET